MFKPRDFNTYVLNGALQNGNITVGLFTADYHVAHYDHVQMSSGIARSGVSNDGVRRYVLSCTQRIQLFNANATSLSPEKDTSSYDDYPALLNAFVYLSLPKGTTRQLLAYSPHTVNTQVQTSNRVSDGKGATSSNSTSNTVGSSTSQTNSFGVSLGNIVSGEHGTTTTIERARTTAHERGSSSMHEASGSADMSIKDWGAYAFVNPLSACPSWTFGQEYPWDAISCRKTSEEPNPRNPTQQVKLVIPTGMALRLFDDVSVRPPSHLSMFGINFVMRAEWLITVPNSVGAEPVQLEHFINYFGASHSVTRPKDEDPVVSVYMDRSPVALSMPEMTEISSVLDLGVMGLEAVGDPRAPCVVGFVPSKFTVAPVNAGGGEQPIPFSIFSTANTLLVRDTTEYPSSCTENTGFGPGETALTATMAGNCTRLSFTLLFKVVDTHTHYTLYLKHWKTSVTAVDLTLIVNGNERTKLNKRVDALEAEGGEHNLLAISLRNLDYASVDYSDMLTLGLNSIEITATPADGSQAVYALRAVSIEAT